MADASQTHQAKQPSNPRARRIRNKEWEALRPEIEKLYLEQGNSRKAVVERLSQNGFPVTPCQSQLAHAHRTESEKQLKQILQKWGSKKNLSSTDMQKMLAF
ncbi:uncharacterized protein A1O5_04068 [Cladophialophora psammophila CBS 110553]|uniref:Clr5 domain-containing protein n=1 Tax=Cladophialophora psammophila CBS 110553 TaxID=1182543 RepID=W9X6I3_9EURO|nr:uncharacterized protein A1O5_04068 [Cladophialophora psammophila CBS 110553]EXJ72920.1 hypothetical protein A1O5_04068 [Cladophialophora psammophila CBS 110553]